MLKLIEKLKKLKENIKKFFMSKEKKFLCQDIL